VTFVEHPKWKPFYNVRLYDGTVTTTDKLTEQQLEFGVDLSWPLSDEQRVAFGLTTPGAMNDD
jgi:hypothetical protein